MMRRVLPVMAAAALVLGSAACGSNSGGGGSAGSTASGGGNAKTVGVILPDATTSPRWEANDRPSLEKAFTAAGVKSDIQNAGGDKSKFGTICDAMINEGVSVLMIVNLDSESGGACLKKAAKAGIPSIDYDRLTLGGGASYYVSFDNVKVGALQGQGLADALKAKPGAQVIQIEGAPTDNNATLFYNGQQTVLQPLFASGALKLVEKQAIPKWDNQVGGTTFEQILTKNGGKVDGVAAANDGLAGAIITVLTKVGLNGKVPVTGQDATPDGLQAILRGDQYMTVFKDISKEAEATAQLAGALAKGDASGADAIATASSDDPTGKRTVKSVLLTPELITKDNVKTVVDAGAVKASEICVPATQAACDQLGIK